MLNPLSPAGYRVFPSKRPKSIKIVSTNPPPKDRPESLSPTFKTTLSNYYSLQTKNVPQRNRYILRTSYGAFGATQSQLSLSKSSMENLSPEKSSPISSFVNEHADGTLGSIASSSPQLNKPRSLRTRNDFKMSKNRSESGLNLSNTMSLGFLKPRRLEKNPVLVNTSVGDSSFTNTFMDNFRKYKISSPARASPPKNASSGLTEINNIKYYAKMTALPKMRSMHKLKDELKSMDEINLVKKNGKPLTSEEELQIKVLKKKVEISSSLRSEWISSEEKRALYKELMLEFHPDKTKHNQSFALEIFYFLQNNKGTLLNE